jgi:hypothetical protein
MNRHILSFIALGVFVLLAIGSTESSSSSVEHSETMAHIMCQDFVKNRLKAPRTAKFPRSSEARTTDLGNGRYRVISYVDAQNSFGALIRTRYACTVQYTGNDRWRLEALDFLE